MCDNFVYMLGWVILGYEVNLRFVDIEFDCLRFLILLCDHFRFLDFNLG